MAFPQRRLDTSAHCGQSLHGPVASHYKTVPRDTSPHPDTLAKAPRTRYCLATWQAGCRCFGRWPCADNNLDAGRHGTQEGCDCPALCWTRPAPTCTCTPRRTQLLTVCIMAAQPQQKHPWTPTHSTGHPARTTPASWGRRKLAIWHGRSLAVRLLSATRADTSRPSAWLPVNYCRCSPPQPQRHASRTQRALVSRWSGTARARAAAGEGGRWLGRQQRGCAARPAESTARLHQMRSQPIARHVMNCTPALRLTMRHRSSGGGCPEAGGHAAQRSGGGTAGRTLAATERGGDARRSSGI